MYPSLPPAFVIVITFEGNVVASAPPSVLVLPDLVFLAVMLSAEAAPLIVAL